MKFAAVVSLSVAAVLATSCSNDSSTSGAATTAKVANPPSAVVQQGIQQLGSVRFRLAASDTSTFITVALASLGLNQTDRACAADDITKYLRPDSDGAVDLDRIGKFITRVSQPDTTIAKQVTACVSPESAARRTAQEPAPDRDVSTIMAIARQVGVGESLAIGLTDTEAACYTDTLLKDLDPGDYASSLVGIVTPAMKALDRSSPTEVLDSCITVDRLYELKASIESGLAALDACESENNAANEAIINEQLKHVNDPTTTTTPGAPPAPSSTLKPCR